MADQDEQSASDPSSSGSSDSSDSSASSGGARSGRGAGKRVDEDAPSSRFGAGLASLLGGAAAFVLMLAIGGYLAFKLLGGPGDGQAEDAPAVQPTRTASAETGDGQFGQPTQDDKNAAGEPANPPSLFEPDDQSSSTEAQAHGQPTGAQRAGDIALRVEPRSAAAFDDVTWAGRWVGHNGAVLALQNKQGGQWVDYKEAARVQGGRFEGTLQSGSSGVNSFRVVDAPSGAVSNVVTVEIY